MVHKNEVQLILYLENIDVPEQYSETLINTINMLLYQLYTSLNNAQLYKSLTEESEKLKETADKLEVSEKRFSLSTKYSELGVWEWNILTGELFWGEMIGPMIGGPAEEIETSFENFISFVHPDDRKKLENAIQLCFDGQEYNVEHRVVWKDGTVRWIQESGDVTRDENGQPLIMLGTAKDITEYKESQETRINLENQLQQAQKMEALGQLSGGIAHDFNNLLGVILGYSELLQLKINKLNDAKMSSQIDQVISSSTRATRLIAQMLAFSRTNEAKSVVTDSSPIVKETIKMLGAMIPSSIHINSKLEKVPYITFDSVQLNQILMNIFINAHHAIGEKGNIDIAMHHHEHIQENCSSCHNVFSGSYVEISITDTGDGIPPDILNNIFNPFYTTKKAGQGTGMGLSMVHGILHGHGGHIIVESTPQKGSVFKLFLHVSSDKLKDEVNDVIHVVDNIHSYRILIVDDEPGIVGFLDEMLSDNNFEVTSYTNSKLALQEIKGNLNNYDCMITDQTMPDISGLDLATEALKINPDFPVIICTGYSDYLDLEMSEKAGIKKLLKKPVTTSNLLNELNNVLAPD